MPTMPTMLTINKLIPQGAGLAPVLLKRATSVQLDWDVRQKSRFDATDSAGRPLGIFLPRGTVVRGGDVLVAEDGSLVRVIASPQPVLHISHCPQHGTPFDLLRAAYHLGNRHVPIELKADHLKIEPDHVLADMLRSMHLIVREDTLAFEPEGGAYSTQGHAHGQDHSKEHAHDHAQGHSHGEHAPAAAQAQGHDHDHDHDHEHEHEHEEHDHSHEHDHNHGHAHDHAHEPVKAKADVHGQGDEHLRGHNHSAHDGHKH